MTSATFKKATDTSGTGDPVKFSAPDLKYVFDVLDGSHSTDRLQLTNIEGYVPAFDVIVYQSGSTVYVRRANGTVLYSAATNTANNDITAINTACNVAVTDAKPTSVWIKPGTYTGTSTSANVTLVSNLTIVAYGVTVKCLASSPSSSYFLFNTGSGFTAVSYVTIFGLTVDCNSLCQGMRFAGSETSGNQSKNILLQDCTFKNIYNNYLLMFSYSIPTGSNQADIPTLKNQDIRVVSCNFIAGDTTNSDSTVPLVHFINTRVFLVQGCIFEGHTATNQAALGVSLYCEFAVISNNTFKSSATGEVRDLILQQARNIMVTNNRCPQKVYIQDCRSMSVSGGNRLNNLKIFDKDNSTTADNHPALYRSTRYMIIANNSFDTVPTYDGQGLDSAIEIDASDNDTNSPKHITITQNTARFRVSFFDLVAALPNGATGGAIEDIMISNNHLNERTSTSSNQGLIHLSANTTLTAHGLNRVFITSNVFCIKDPASPAINDIDVGGTGFTNLVIRKNYFVNEGINNVTSYSTSISRNFGDATTRRDFNSGIASISSNTFVDVTHGLQYTPNLQDIYVVPTTALGGSATTYWVSAVTSTTFTITINSSSSPSFAWRAGRIA